MTPPSVPLRPLVSWPHLAEPGRSYLVTVDVEIAGTEPVPDWPYDQEEFAIGCMLAGCPGIEIEALGSTAVVLHRFGGTYGPARFVAHAADNLPAPGTESGEPRLQLTLITAGGVPFRTVNLPITVSRETDAPPQQEPPRVLLPSRERRSAEPLPPERLSEAIAPPEPRGFLPWEPPSGAVVEDGLTGVSIVEPVSTYDGGHDAPGSGTDSNQAEHWVESVTAGATAFQVGRDLTVHHHHAGPGTDVGWPVRVGAVPPLASGFQPREALREAIDRAHGRHATVVLTQVLSGGGGVGKSQLAAARAHQAHAEGVDVLVWVNATETAQIIAAYAQAAARAGVPGADGQDAESDATAFLDWLAVTDRTWLVVLDDLTDIEDAAPWWPRPPAGANGRVLATTRRRDALVTGGGRARVDIGTYTTAEAIDYLRERLAEADAGHLLGDRADDLAEALGRLPLALAHAAAYMMNEGVDCTGYLGLFADRASRLETLLPTGADTDGYGRQVTASLLLALDVAQGREPVGLAAPALRLAAHLDPAGHPQQLWGTDAVTHYLTMHRTAPGPGSRQSGPVTPDQARATLRLLHHYALLTHDPRDGDRAVRLNALTARAARETTPSGDTPGTVHTAADALQDIWPEHEHTARDLAAVLRANADALAAHAGDLLWRPDGHPVLFTAGISLNSTGLIGAAAAHWHRLAADAERLLGNDHPETLTSRSNLAFSYWQAGRTGEAIVIEEQVLADRERILGHDHPDTLFSRSNLARSYQQAGRTGEAIAIEEQVLADRERILGHDHPDTLTSRANLAISYQQAGRTGEAIAIEEQVLADRERILGHDHPDTLTSRANLAISYQQAGRTGEAINLLEQVLADSERILGHDHPDTREATDVLRRWQTP
ncbi:tetratricopeptide repeat protein [Kitasatospora sp. NPDC058406]|uniref:tetratricopeptide repeat protein n=1 Tax=Kitasatospora sp. NPDC058406 TaxID=3346483 RepID=UPI003669E6CA